MRLKFSITDFTEVEGIEPRISPTCCMLTVIFTDGECMTQAFHEKDDMVNAYKFLLKEWEKSK